ncbi:hypothetical protein CQW23_17697 [Capsicum baccatum]|uniref:Heme-binding protein 2 n=1 Tax=Capsicum baccatum TaxID=33114 RepID=A0A2G2WEM4_CAPBA|nr:hypothetical protein CQW23_17697 [Capsicum baccatum]
MVLGVWMIKLCLFLILVSKLSNAGYSTKLDFYPPPCERIECPDYELIESGKDYEIRLYNSAMWMSTPPIDDTSFFSGTTTGFQSLYNYRHGKNSYKEEIGMTVPVLAQVKPSDGPFSTSSFVVSFYVPKKNQPNPLPAGTKWAEAVEKSQAADDTTVYKVAQYNSPSESNNRVNELWSWFQPLNESPMHACFRIDRLRYTPMEYGLFSNPT